MEREWQAADYFFIKLIGTVAGTIISFFLLKNYIPYLDKIGAMMSASYIGGGVNFAAMAAKFEAPGEWVSATIVADNLMMAIYFVILMVLPAIPFFKKHYNTPHVLEVERGIGIEDGKTLSKIFWKRKDISLKDIALSVGTSFLLVIISFEIAQFFDNIIPSGERVNVIMNFLNALLGDKYLMLTTLTFVTLTMVPKYFDSINGSQEIGTYLIYFFFFVIGIPASLSYYQKRTFAVVICLHYRND